MARKNKFTRRGFFPIIGSSLLIPFIGKAQSEPDQINEDDYQIVLSDTPGILDPSYKL